MTDTFDFVVVGGGSGGCAVAGRLSEDPRTSVALLEAGGAGDNWVVTTPGALAELLRCRRHQSRHPPVFHPLFWFQGWAFIFKLGCGDRI